MADVNGPGAIGTGSPSAQELAQLKAMQAQYEMNRAQAARGQKTEAAVMTPVTAPTKQEAAQINGFMNQAAGHVEYFKGQNFTMPKPKQAEGGAPAVQAGKAEAASAPTEQEQQINADAKEVVQFNTARLDQQEQAKDLLPPLPWSRRIRISKRSLII
jgi:hypothetical protein